MNEIKTIEDEIQNLQNDEATSKPKDTSGYKKYAEEKKRLLESVKNF